MERSERTRGLEFELEHLSDTSTEDEEMEKLVATLDEQFEKLHDLTLESGSSSESDGTKFELQGLVTRMGAIIGEGWNMKELPDEFLESLPDIMLSDFHLLGQNKMLMAKIMAPYFVEKEGFDGMVECVKRVSGSDHLDDRDKEDIEASKSANLLLLYFVTLGTFEDLGCKMVNEILEYSLKDEKTLEKIGKDWHKLSGRVQLLAVKMLLGSFCLCQPNCQLLFHIALLSDGVGVWNDLAYDLRTMLEGQELPRVTSALKTIAMISSAWGTHEVFKNYIVECFSSVLRLLGKNGAAGATIKEMIDSGILEAMGKKAREKVFRRLDKNKSDPLIQEVIDHYYYLWGEFDSHSN